MKKQFIACAIFVVILVVVSIFGCQQQAEPIKPAPESDAKPTPTITETETKPPPAPEKESPPTTPEEEIQAPIPTSIHWGEWGFPTWGPEYKATTDKTRMIFKDDALIVLGPPLPKDEIYYVCQKKLDNSEPIHSPMEMTVKYKPGTEDIGVVVTSKEEKVIRIKTGSFARGEALQCALMNDDKTVMVFAKEMPYPIENKQGKYRIWVELASPEGNTFIIWGEGFEPDEEISTTSSSNGEVIKSKVKVNNKGQFMTILFPSVVGKTDGLATFGAVGKSGEVEVSYQWGPPALKSAQ